MRDNEKRRVLGYNNRDIIPARVINYVKAFGIKIKEVKDYEFTDSVLYIGEFWYENEKLRLEMTQGAYSYGLFLKGLKNPLFNVHSDMSDASDASFTFQKRNCAVTISQIENPSNTGDIELSVDFDRGSQVSSCYDLRISTDVLGNVSFTIEECRFVVGSEVAMVGLQHCEAPVYLERMKTKIDECSRVGDQLEKDVLKAMVSDPLILKLLHERISAIPKTFKEAYEAAAERINKRHTDAVKAADRVYMEDAKKLAMAVAINQVAENFVNASKESQSSDKHK